MCLPPQHAFECTDPLVFLYDGIFPKHCDLEHPSIQSMPQDLLPSTQYFNILLKPHIRQAYDYRLSRQRRITKLHNLVVSGYKGCRGKFLTMKMAVMFSPKRCKASNRLHWLITHNSPQYNQNQTNHKYKLPLAVRTSNGTPQRSDLNCRFVLYKCRIRTLLIVRVSRRKKFRDLTA